MPTSPNMCPGQSSMFWRPSDIYDLPCPTCGGAVEFFKTDIRRTCKGCGTRILNPRVDFSCAEWCAVAKDCMGPELYGDLREKQDLYRRRETDLKALLETVDPADTDVRRLFERLYRENRYADRLIDTDRLFLLKDEDESLFAKAILHYRAFAARRQGEQRAKEQVAEGRGEGSGVASEPD